MAARKKAVKKTVSKKVNLSEVELQEAPCVSPTKGIKPIKKNVEVPKEVIVEVVKVNDIRKTVSSNKMISRSARLIDLLNEQKYTDDEIHNTLNQEYPSVEKKKYITDLRWNFNKGRIYKEKFNSEIPKYTRSTAGELIEKIKCAKKNEKSNDAGEKIALTISKLKG